VALFPSLLRLARELGRRVFSLAQQISVSPLDSSRHTLDPPSITGGQQAQPG